MGGGLWVHLSFGDPGNIARSEGCGTVLVRVPGCRPPIEPHIGDREHSSDDAGFSSIYCSQQGPGVVDSATLPVSGSASSSRLTRIRGRHPSMSRPGQVDPATDEAHGRYIGPQGYFEPTPVCFSALSRSKTSLGTTDGMRCCLESHQVHVS